VKFFDGTEYSVQYTYPASTSKKSFCRLRPLGSGQHPQPSAHCRLTSSNAPPIRLTPEHPFHHSHFLNFFFPDISLQSVRDSQPNLELVEPIFRTGPVFLWETSIRVRNRIIPDQAKLPLGFCAHDEPQIQWTPTSGQRSVQDRPQRAWKILFSKTQLARPFYRG
jgi:hypothetical protein